jgi:hypothetical protein
LNEPPQGSFSESPLQIYPIPLLLPVSPQIPTRCPTTRQQLGRIVPSITHEEFRLVGLFNKGHQGLLPPPNPTALHTSPPLFLAAQSLIPFRLHLLLHISIMSDSMKVTYSAQSSNFETSFQMNLKNEVNYL